MLGGRREKPRMGSVANSGTLSAKKNHLDHAGDQRSHMDSLCLLSGNLSQNGPFELSEPSCISTTVSHALLERANQGFTQRHQSGPKVFLDQSQTSLGARSDSQYSTSSRLSSVKFTATIVEEKQDSTLNKAIKAVRGWFFLRHFR